MAKHYVMTYGRANPPTSGHAKVFDKVKEIANEVKGDHDVILSHSHDPKKNPLSPEDKVKFAKLISPDVNIKASTKALPTIMHHATEAHKNGYDHLHVVAGSDRVEEYKTLLNKYNGPDKLYNFKSITVHSAGHRDPDAEGDTGISGTKMREFAKANDIESYKKGLPKHIAHDDAVKMMHSVRSGMKLDESFLNRLMSLKQFALNLLEDRESYIALQKGGWKKLSPENFSKLNTTIEKFKSEGPIRSGQMASLYLKQGENYNLTGKPGSEPSDNNMKTIKKRYSNKGEHPSLFLSNMQTLDPEGTADLGIVSIKNRNGK